MFSSKSTALGRFVGVAAALICGVVQEAALGREPEPFRRDEIEGRDFEYNDLSFLHRFTYRPPPSWLDKWEDLPNGFRITAGSTRASELYVQNELRTKIQFNKKFFGEIRFERNEDFDSRYDRFLTGVGFSFLEQYSTTVLADIVSDKENVDLQFELARNFPQGNRFRLALIAVDWLFNEKNDQNARYRDTPYTLFAEILLLREENFRIYAWLNWNPKLSLEFTEDSSEFSYQQLQAGTRISFPLTKTWSIRIDANTEIGKRNYSQETGIEYSTRRFKRKHLHSTLEIHHTFTSSLDAFLGYRYFYLSEEDVRCVEAISRAEHRRRESSGYFGVFWEMHEKITFWPALYVNYYDNENYSPFDNTEDRAKRDVNAKAAFALQYHFSKKATALINPTLETPGGPFGGLNVQFLVLF